jgi:ATP-dependent RNA helicase SUPV3L1/SUV3
VRVDILERLADLIRPATNWKPGLGPRPEGAYDGHAFTVTPAMMSILGANADDMEEILKGLGYRAEPKPAAEVKARLEAQDAADRAAAAAKLAAKEAEAIEADATAGLSAEEAERPADASPAADAAAPETPVAAEPQATPQAISEAETQLVEEEAAAMTADATAGLLVEETDQPDDGTTAPEPPLQAAETDVPAGEAVEPDTGGDTAAEAQAKTDETAAPEEQPKPILLWRQARFERPRGNHRHHGGHGRGAHAGEPARDAEKGEGRGDGKGGRPRFDRNRFKGKPAQQGEGASRNQGKPNRQGGRPEGKGGAPGKPVFQGKPREERPARFDPDSPFAKLAALREQLKK